MECDFTKSDLIDGSTISSEKFKHHLEQRVLDPIWKPVVMKVATECLALTTKYNEDIKKQLASPPHNIKPEECNIRFMALVDCIVLKLLAVCPANFWNNSRTCNAVQDFIEGCFEDDDNLPLLLSTGLT